VIPRRERYNKGCTVKPPLKDMAIILVTLLIYIEESSVGLEKSKFRLSGWVFLP